MLCKIAATIESPFMKCQIIHHINCLKNQLGILIKSKVMDESNLVIHNDIFNKKLMPHSEIKLGYT